MRFCYFSSSQAQWLAQQPIPLPAAEGVGGFTWAQITRSELAAQPEALQELAQQHGQQRVLPLHMSDLLNAQHPSRYDYSSHYDVLIFRRLLSPADALAAPLAEHARALETTPVAFVLFDNLLLTVLDETQVWDEAFVARFMQEGRLPHSPADLMLRIINALVDDFLNQRKTLSARLQHWQAQLKVLRWSCTPTPVSSNGKRCWPNARISMIWRACARSKAMPCKSGSIACKSKVKRPRCCTAYSAICYWRAAATSWTTFSA